jgi:hypothetical protein
MDELYIRSPRDQLLAVLAEAKSNKAAMGSGADVFKKLAETGRVTPKRAASHIAMTSLVDAHSDRGDIARFSFQRKNFKRATEGRISMVTGQIVLQDRSTMRVHDLAVCALHFGGVDFYAVVKNFPGQKAFDESARRLADGFPTASLPAMLRLSQSEFGPEEYGLEHVLPDGREHITTILFADLIQKFSEDYARLYQEHKRTLEILQGAGFELPKELRAAAEFTLGRMFEDEIRSQEKSQDPGVYKRALEIASEVSERGLSIDRTISSMIFTDMINGHILVAVTRPGPEDVEAARTLIQLTKKLGLAVNLESAQEAVYETLVNGSGSAVKALEPLALLLGISPTAMA